jgi:hypothetical protein
MCRALDIDEFMVGKISVQDAHLSTESRVVYEESSCVTESITISVRTSETIFETGGLSTVSKARQAYSTSPRSAKVTSKSMPSVPLCRLAGLKYFLEFAGGIKIAVVAVLATPSLRSILGDGLVSRLQISHDDGSL